MKIIGGQSKINPQTGQAASALNKIGAVCSTPKKSIGKFPIYWLIASHWVVMIRIHFLITCLRQLIFMTSPTSPQQFHSGHYLQKLRELQGLSIIELAQEFTITATEIMASKGDVDHLLPKSVFPGWIYEWNNFIWCCKECNQQKSNFYSYQYPLFNPCSKIDCAQLAFIEATGQYTLTAAVANAYYWQKRFENSVCNIFFNDKVNCDNRRDSIEALRGCFESVERCLQELNQIDSAMPSNPELEALFAPTIDNRKLEVSESINKIQRQMTNIQFYLLKQAKYQQLQQQFPLTAERLNQV